MIQAIDHAASQPQLDQPATTDSMQNLLKWRREVQIQLQKWLDVHRRPYEPTLAQIASKRESLRSQLFLVVDLCGLDRMETVTIASEVPVEEDESTCITRKQEKQLRSLRAANRTIIPALPTWGGLDKEQRHQMSKAQQKARQIQKKNQQPKASSSRASKKQDMVHANIQPLEIQYMWEDSAFESDSEAEIESPVADWFKSLETIESSVEEITEGSVGMSPDDEGRAIDLMTDEKLAGMSKRELVRLMKAKSSVKVGVCGCLSFFLFFSISV